MPQPRCQHEALSEVLGAADAPVKSNLAATSHGAQGQHQHHEQTGITAQACQQPAAQLHCSESLDTPSPPPSSPAQAPIDSAADLPPDMAAAAEEAAELKERLAAARSAAAVAKQGAQQETFQLQAQVLCRMHPL